MFHWNPNQDEVFMENDAMIHCETDCKITENAGFITN